MKEIRIGTRGSRLALVQSGQVLAALQKSFPEHRFELVPIKTTGDNILDVSLSKIGDKGLFTKEIEKELLAGSIDMAVHSMKDMPTQLPEGLRIGAATERLNPRDALISKKGKRLVNFKEGDTIATGSLRRKAQLLAFNPGLNIVDMRGNVQSRIKKMNDDPAIDATILACAGIERLNMMDIITEIIPEQVITPAVSQGSLAVEVRAGDPEAEALADFLNHPDSMIAISCERAFLAELGGGCQVPIAGLARVSGGTLTLTGMVASVDGTKIYRSSISGSVENFSAVGKDLAQRLLDEGADKILKSLFNRP
jgi:hydroxymethylbilane synthase